MRGATLCYTIEILKDQRQILEMLDRISSIFGKNPKMENWGLYVTVDISKTIILGEFLMFAIDKTHRFTSDNTKN